MYEPAMQLDKAKPRQRTQALGSTRSLDSGVTYLVSTVG